MKRIAESIRRRLHRVTLEATASIARDITKPLWIAALVVVPLIALF